MKIYRYIAGLLLLCFSVFLIHNLVPHHHHSEVFQSPIATDCPFEHGDHDGYDHNHDADADEHPIHCHAFNDVVFEKNGHTIQYPGNSQIQVMLASHELFMPDAPPLLTPRPSVLLKLPFSSDIDLGTRALRAPPSFA